jgi:hypothetical protein
VINIKAYPVIEPGTLNPMHPRLASAPKGADAVYLYSDTQAKEAKDRGVVVPSFRSDDKNPELAFTERMHLGEGFALRYANWEHQYPDGRIMGYHTPTAQEFYHKEGLRSPRLLHPAP